MRTTNKTVAVKENVKVSFKWNRKTAEVCTWIGGEFMGAKLMEIDAAREKLARLAGDGFVGEREVGPILGYTISMKALGI